MVIYWDSSTLLFSFHTEILITPPYRMLAVLEEIIILIVTTFSFQAKNIVQIFVLVGVSNLHNHHFLKTSGIQAWLYICLLDW